MADSGVEDVTLLPKHVSGLISSTKYEGSAQKCTYPRAVHGAFRPSVNEQVVEKTAEGAAQERGDHWYCHIIAISISSKTMPKIEEHSAYFSLRTGSCNSSLNSGETIFKWHLLQK